ncbi:MAG TPA: YhcH/YjgK/YiaL family protein [Chthoniobacteraceae bacterium]|jgi:YhcH/YjgK/YiaL family protein|nr:YhcH/YjgK/YiaL family protein [Chthoniobacteraceae bacterium]
MIADTLAQSSRYASLAPRFAAAFAFLRHLSADQPLGRHDIDGDDCFALVQAYTTKPIADAKFEAHRSCIDIQFIQSGQETLLWAPLAGLAETRGYDGEKDFALFATPLMATPLRLRAGEFTIFFPEDAHAPGLELDGPCQVRKVVIKVRI